MDKHLAIIEVLTRYRGSDVRHKKRCMINHGRSDIKNEGESHDRS